MREALALTLSDLLGDVASTHGDRPALVAPSPSGDRTLSFNQLRDEVDRVAGGLHARGFRTGDRLAVWLPNLPEWLVLTLAAARLGVLAIGVNPRFRSGELAQVMIAARPRGLVLWPGFKAIDFPGIFAQAVAESGVEAPEVFSIGGGLGTDYEQLRSGTGRELPDSRPDSLVIAFLTSGTTASPKVAAHRQEGVVRHSRALSRASDYRPGDAFLGVIPLCGVAGYFSSLAALAAGGRVVLQPLFDAVEAAAWIPAYGITHAMGFDLMLRAIIDASPDPALRFATWRRATFGMASGSAIDFVRWAESKVPTRFLEAWGASEAQGALASQPFDAPAEIRATPGGQAVDPEIQFRATDLDTGAVLPSGETGELQVRGYTVMAGYIGNDAATAAAFSEDGWLKTGDLAYTQADGSFVYFGRIKDTLRLRGFLVDPVEVEGHLQRHPAVEMAQVVGVVDPAIGEVAVAFVRLQAGAVATQAELQDHCRAGMANYKVPERVFFVDRFPSVMGPNGEKVQKNKLREMAIELGGSVVG